jgi:2-C-methyl-D-erythritol 4-phosphate cytidylyltransferase
MAIWCVVPAAGSGSRFGSALPKQYLLLNDFTIMQHTLDRLGAVPAIAGIVVAIAANDSQALGLPYRFEDKLQFITGGATRADSVLAGLEALEERAGDDDWVLVHDVARPCVRVADIEKLLQVAGVHPVGGILANRVRDTMKRSDAQGSIIATVPREDLWHALTPQMFRYGLLRRALLAAMAGGREVTDEAAAVEQLGLQPCLVEGARDNLKITFAEDLRLAEILLREQADAES